MKTICARSVLAGREAFATVGEVVVKPDREIVREDLLDADALVIRSKTTVNRSLLEGTRVAFVGTATAGFDHIDGAACADLGVAWTAAPGCNATSVAEYITAALLTMAEKGGFDLAGRTIAVVGVGQVGRRVVAKASALGMRPLQNDPPRAQTEGDAVLRPLDEILPQADIVTLHVPLTDDGPFATRGMVDCRFLERLKPGALFFNASRGEVVDEAALKLALAGGQVSAAVLDVWDHEPEIDPALLDAAAVGTPHIAGYSWDGKLAGTAQVYEAACRFFEIKPSWDSTAIAPGTPPPEVAVPTAGRSDQEVLRDLVLGVYDLARDDRDLRGARAPEGETLAVRFERLRKKYWTRREFPAARIALPGAAPELLRLSAALGFRVNA
ncbi:MAG: 4-phosphoerythronate dehydrogenase [Lentisphaerae bacterium]|nr:4-phosphoerythronate dehydrogenase [Lentisphaerota bacterium]